MDISFFNRLHDEGIIDTQELTNIELQVRKPESVYWDLRTLLYLGIGGSGGGGASGDF